MALNGGAAVFEISDIAPLANARGPCCRPVSLVLALGIQVLVTLVLALGASYRSSLAHQVPVDSFSPSDGQSKEVHHVFDEGLSLTNLSAEEVNQTVHTSLSLAGGSTEVGSLHSSALQQLKQRCRYGHYSTSAKHFQVWNDCFDLAGIDIVMRAVVMIPGLRRLDMSFCDISDAGAQAIADALPQIPNLDILLLLSNKIGDAGAHALANALKHNQNQNLEWLDLAENDIGGAGANALADAMKHIPNLKGLFLGGNEFGNKIGDVGAQALANALPQIPNLEKLTLRGSNIGDAGAKALAKALSQISNLKRLSLWSNKIGDVGAQALAEALPKIPNLGELSLFNNTIGDVGAQALANALKQIPNLTTLSLLSNKIGDVGAQALADAMKQIQNLNLHYLDMGLNKFSTAGRQALNNAIDLHADLSINLP